MQRSGMQSHTIRSVERAEFICAVVLYSVYRWPCSGCFRPEHAFPVSLQGAQLGDQVLFTEVYFLMLREVMEENKEGAKRCAKTSVMRVICTARSVCGFSDM